MSKNINSQKIEQLLRQAFSQGGIICAWVDSQLEKNKPIPENLYEEAFIKFIEDNKDFINCFVWNPKSV